MSTVSPPKPVTDRSAAIGATHTAEKRRPPTNTVGGRPPAQNGAADTATESDAELAVGAAAGCEWSFARLVDRYKDRVYGLVRQRCPDAQTAEDLTQETFLSAWRSLGRYDPTRPFETWLFTIAVRRAASLARRRRVREAVENAVPLHGGECGSEPERNDGAPGGEWLWELASRVLSGQANTLLWLVYAEGLSPTEAGRVVNRPGVAVRVLLHRARKRLAEAAREEMDAGGTKDQSREGGA